MYYNAMVERRRADIEVTEIEISDEKEGYIRTEKGVLRADVREVYGLEPRFFVRQGERGPEYAMLGPNGGGRYLSVAIAPRETPGQWRLITAYWLREGRGRRLYEEGE